TSVVTASAGSVTQAGAVEAPGGEHDDGKDEIYQTEGGLQGDADEAVGAANIIDIEGDDDHGFPKGQRGQARHQLVHPQGDEGQKHAGGKTQNGPRQESEGKGPVTIGGEHRTQVSAHASD